jgi:hypothetical protein
LILLSAMKAKITLRTTTLSKPVTNEAIAQPLVGPVAGGRPGTPYGVPHGIPGLLPYGVFGFPYDGVPALPYWPPQPSAGRAGALGWPGFIACDAPAGS